MSLLVEEDDIFLSLSLACIIYRNEAKHQRADFWSVSIDVRHTHTHSLSLSHTHARIHTHTPALTLSQTLSLSHSSTLTHSYTHTHTHVLSLSLSHSFSLSHTPFVWTRRWVRGGNKFLAQLCVQLGKRLTCQMCFVFTVQTHLTVWCYRQYFLLTNTYILISLSLTLIINLKHLWAQFWCVNNVKFKLSLTSRSSSSRFDYIFLSYIFYCP